MELKLTDGKYARGNYQQLAEVDEIYELMQRIEMKLKVRRGVFVPMPEYGSRLHLLAQTKSANREIAARQYVLEAIADENELELHSLELTSTADGDARLYLTFIYKGEYRIDLETEI